MGCEFELRPGRRWEGIRKDRRKVRRDGIGRVFLVCSVLFFCSCHSIHPSYLCVSTFRTLSSAPSLSALSSTYLYPYPTIFVFVVPFVFRLSFSSSFIKSTAISWLLTVYVVHLKKDFSHSFFVTFVLCFEIVCISSVLALCSLVQMKS